MIRPRLVVEYYQLVLVGTNRNTVLEAGLNLSDDQLEMTLVIMRKMKIDDYHSMMKLVECCTLLMAEGRGTAMVPLVVLGMLNIDVVVLVLPVLVVVVVDLQKIMVVQCNYDNLV